MIWVWHWIEHIMRAAAAAKHHLLASSEHCMHDGRCTMHPTRPAYCFALRSPPHVFRPARFIPCAFPPVLFCPVFPQASDALRQMLDPDSKPGAAMRKHLPAARAPALPDLFAIGQFVRCSVVRLGGDAEDDGGGSGGGGGGGKKGRVQLSLRLKRVCEGVGQEGLSVGRCVPAVVRSVEDRVYTLSFGIKVGEGLTGV